MEIRRSTFLGGEPGMTSSILRQASAACVCVVAVTLPGAGAHAAGFQLREQSSEMIGNAFAGSAAKALTAATIWYNPAGMTLLEGNHIAGSLSWIAPRAEYSGTGTGPLGKGTGGLGGDAIQDAAVGSNFAMYSWSKDLKFGLAVVAPFGLRTNYPSNWVGRYWANDASITSIAFNPNFAWRVNQNLSIGGGPVVQWSKAEISQMVNQNAIYYAKTHTLPPTSFADGMIGFDGGDIGYGFNVGALWEFSKTSRVGVSYRSQVQHTLSGNATAVGGPLAAAYLASVAPDGKVTADVTLPATATLSLYHELNPQWAVMADLQWTGWSSFDRLRVKGKAGDLTNTVEDWRDTWFVSLGTSYKFVPGHTLHFGAAYDMGAVKDAKHRYPSIPDSDRYWLTTGYTWDVSEKVQWNIGYAHIFGKQSDVTIAEASKGTMTGKYDASVDIVSTSFVYKF